MNLDSKITKLKQLKLAFNDCCKRREFSGIRFECVGDDFKCEIWFCEIWSEAHATSMLEAFTAACSNLMNIARVVSDEKSEQWDTEREHRRSVIYERWVKLYPSEPFNLILAIDRNLI